MAYAVYEQRTGMFVILSVEDGGIERVLYEKRGYSGRDRCRNNHECEVLKAKGPIPCGFYRIVEAAHRRFNPPSFRLDPVSTNEMHGRSGFWIHGDSMTNPGNASHGCIILDLNARIGITVYQPETLEVVPGAAERGDLNNA